MAHWYAYNLTHAIFDLRVNADKTYAAADRLSERGALHAARVLRGIADTMLSDADEMEIRNERMKRSVS